MKNNQIFMMELHFFPRWLHNQPGLVFGRKAVKKVARYRAKHIFQDLAACAERMSQQHINNIFSTAARKSRWTSEKSSTAQKKSARARMKLTLLLFYYIHSLRRLSSRLFSVRMFIEYNLRYEKKVYLYISHHNKKQRQMMRRRSRPPKVKCTRA